MKTDIHVGSTVWVFDQNRRDWERDASGKRSKIIYRYHWEECTIVGENRASWILPNGESFPKRPKDTERLLHTYRLDRLGNWSCKRVALSLQEVDDDCWQDEHRQQIVRYVDRCDAATLRKVAELVGYEERKAIA
jgi:hypothetical protein